MDIKFKFTSQFQTSLSNKEVIFPVEEIKGLNNFWLTFGSKVEEAFKEVTGLSFLEKIIPCYLNSEFSVSDPLCLKIEKIDDMIDNLIHELIHVILTQNKIGETEKWKNLMEQFKEEVPLTKVHVIIHAIHQKVYEKLGFTERINVIQNNSVKPPYIRAWEIALSTPIELNFV